MPFWFFYIILFIGLYGYTIFSKKLELRKFLFILILI